LNLRYSIYQHVVMLETTYLRLFSYVPPDVLAVKTLRCDLTAVTAHNNAFFEGMEDLRAFMLSITARQRRTCARSAGSSHR
jgi:hypothetical protein